MQAEGGIPDPELARIVAAWPALPEPIRRAVLAMLEAGGPPAAEQWEAGVKGGKMTV